MSITILTDTRQNIDDPFREYQFLNETLRMTKSSVGQSAVGNTQIPAGRLGIVHSSLQTKSARHSRIPQPGGWGSFIPAYVIQLTFLKPNRSGLRLSREPGLPIGGFEVCGPPAVGRNERPQPAGWGIWKDPGAAPLLGRNELPSRKAWGCRPYQILVSPGQTDRSVGLQPGPG